MGPDQQLVLAGYQVEDKLLASFAESFQRYNVTVLPLPSANSAELSQREVHACVIPLNETAMIWLKKSAWFSPKRTVIYGIGGAEEITRYVKLGIHALLPNESDSSVRVAVESTQSLLARGIGKCERVPLATLVTVEAEGKTLTGITRNVGSGGMALHLLRNAALPHPVTLNFVLPDAGSFSLPASPRWYSGRLVGLQFQSLTHLPILKKWVNEYSLLGCGIGVPKASRAFA